MRYQETIIIGGGVSGLSCARRLCDANKDFLLISKDIGGRTLSSKSHVVDYGAAFITSNYENMEKYVEKVEPMKLKDFYFFDGKAFNNFFIIKNLRFLPKLIKLYLIIKKFRRHYLKYRKKAPFKSFKECFEEDEVLMKFWKTPAKDFITKHGLEEFDHFYGGPCLTGSSFAETSEVNCVYYLGAFFPLLEKAWIVNFKHTIEKLTKGYEDKILIGTVKKIKKEKEDYIVKTSIGDFKAKNVVLASPEKSVSKIHDLPKPHLQAPVFVFHVVGRRKDIYQDKKGIVFRPKHYDVFVIWKQKNGADLVYSKHPKPDFKQYYEIYHVVKRIHWDPGIVIPGSEINDQEFKKNFYLASDYNVSILEDCFLSGLYIANQIIKKSKI